MTFNFFKDLKKVIFLSELFLFCNQYYNLLILTSFFYLIHEIMLIIIYIKSLQNLFPYYITNIFPIRRSYITFRPIITKMSHEKNSSKSSQYLADFFFCIIFFVFSSQDLFISNIFTYA